MLRLAVSVVLSLAALLSFPHLAHSQTTTWYLCAILQASTYQSIDQAVLVVNSTATQIKDYNGNVNPAYNVLSITSGSRTFTDLTAATPTPVTVQMANLAPVGSTGGNDNLFWPGTYPQMLDGNGLTFNFQSAIPVAGQASGTQMNLWWASGSNQLGEEVASGTHETSPLQSTLSITQTQQLCTVPNYAQFSMCLLINGNGYRTSISAFVNTTGTAQRVTSTSANGLSGTLQGWTVASVGSGQRVYTPTSGAAASTTTLSGLAAANTVAGNDNIVFPDSAGNGTFDAAGVAFTLASAAPFADGSSASSLAIKYSNGQYYEQTPTSTESTSSSYISMVPYYQGTSVPLCSAVATQYQFFWSVNGTGLFSSVITGYMAINPLAAGTATKPYWNIVCVTGRRVYTDYTTSTTTVNTITSLLSTGHIGGNDNRLYIGAAQQLDGDGFSLEFDGQPTLTHFLSSTTALYCTASYQSTRHHIRLSLVRQVSRPSSARMEPTKPTLWSE